MRILLVEDDPGLGASVRDALRRGGHTVDWVRDGAAAQSAGASGGYAAVVLDLGLPQVGGMDVLRMLRASGISAPILIISARTAVPDRVRGLDAGADDYLVKPFELEEISARVRALIRRGAGNAGSELRIGEVVLDLSRRACTLAGRTVPLSAQEFCVLEALMSRPGRVLSRAQLEERLYGWGDSAGSNVVEVHVHRLRRKLGTQFIRTMRGAGYRIDAPTHG